MVRPTKILFGYRSKRPVPTNWTYLFLIIFLEDQEREAVLMNKDWLSSKDAVEGCTPRDNDCV